jgi:flagellar biosynthesis protein FliQ
MNEAEVGALIRDGMLVILKLGGPLLLAGLVVGLLVSLVQAITQLNEATLAFVPKLVVLGVVALLLGPFMFSTLSTYTALLLARIATPGGP